MDSSKPPRTRISTRISTPPAALQQHPQHRYYIDDDQLMKLANELAKFDPYQMSMDWEKQLKLNNILAYLRWVSRGEY